jgi:hypothetical protein
MPAWEQRQSRVGCKGLPRAPRPTPPPHGPLPPSPAVVGPIVGPLLGGGLSEVLGWRSTFASMAVCGVVVIIALLIFMEEVRGGGRGGGGRCGEGRPRCVRPLEQEAGGALRGRWAPLLRCPVGAVSGGAAAAQFSKALRAPASGRRRAAPHRAEASPAGLKLCPPAGPPVPTLPPRQTQHHHILKVRGGLRRPRARRAAAARPLPPRGTPAAPTAAAAHAEPPASGAVPTARPPPARPPAAPLPRAQRLRTTEGALAVLAIREHRDIQKPRFRAPWHPLK